MSDGESTAQAMNVQASGLKIDEVAQSARRRLVLRSLLQAQDPPVVTFTKTLSPDGLSGMSQEGSPGSELQGPADFGSFVQADAFDYVADLQLTAESVDISAELTGSTGGGVVMAVTPLRVRRLDRRMGGWKSQMPTWRLLYLPSKP